MQRGCQVLVFAGRKAEAPILQVMDGGAASTRLGQLRTAGRVR